MHRHGEEVQDPTRRRARAPLRLCERNSQTSEGRGGRCWAGGWFSNHWPTRLVKEAVRGERDEIAYAIRVLEAMVPPWRWTLGGVSR